MQTSRNRIVVGVSSDVKYASIHNEGGQIKITPKMRRYFWAMYIETKQEYWKGLALTKKEHIIIPQRQFIGDSEALFKSIDRMIVKELEIALK
jgi:phage gpG-like protein